MRARTTRRYPRSSAFAAGFDAVWKQEAERDALTATIRPIKLKDDAGVDPICIKGRSIAVPGTGKASLVFDLVPASEVRLKGGIQRSEVGSALQDLRAIGGKTVTTRVLAYEIAGPDADDNVIAAKEGTFSGTPKTASGPMSRTWAKAVATPHCGRFCATWSRPMTNARLTLFCHSGQPGFWPGLKPMSSACVVRKFEPDDNRPMLSSVICRQEYKAKPIICMPDDNRRFLLSLATPTLTTQVCPTRKGHICRQGPNTQFIRSFPPSVSRSSAAAAGMVNEDGLVVATSGRRFAALRIRCSVSSSCLPPHGMPRGSVHALSSHAGPRMSISCTYVGHFFRGVLPSGCSSIGRLVSPMRRALPRLASGFGRPGTASAGEHPFRTNPKGKFP